MPQPKSLSYRYDLDGLRGIAIALVVIFHVYVGRVSGGVDIFLLLSGYFFLGSQLRYSVKPEALLNPWWPVWRTIRRLVPSLILVLCAVALLLPVLAPELRNAELYKQFTASVFYYQNWELARQHADYNAASPSTSVLQHLWSMAVQGQFYLAAIAFATLVAIIWKLIKHFSPSVDPQRYLMIFPGIVLIIVTIVSFIYASRDGIYGTALNYYSTFSRAWELTLGAVLAVFAWKLRLPRAVATAFCVVGLFLIVSTGVLIADTTAFPGPLALVPLGGAVFVIIAGNSQSNVVTRALASRFARWLGSVAYALYLWHWPLLILATTKLNQDFPSWQLGTGIIALSLLLAELTHRFVERPLQQADRRPIRSDSPWRRGFASIRTSGFPQLKAAAVVLILVAVSRLLSMQVAYEEKIEQAHSQPHFSEADYPGALALFGANAPSDAPYRPDPELISGIYPEPGDEGCVTMSVEPSDSFHKFTTKGKDCIYGDPDSDTTVVIAGGSHAEQWASPIHQLGLKHGFKVVPIARQGCPIISGDWTEVTPECAQWGELAIQKIIAMQPDLVISSSTRPGTIVVNTTGLEGTETTAVSGDIVPQGYVNFWQRLSWSGIPFLGLRDNPWGFDENGKPVDLTVCMVKTGGDVKRCSMPRERFYAATDPAKEFETWFPNVHMVDTSDWFCTSTTCPPVIGNLYVYRDQNHISKAYALSTETLLWKEIRPLLQLSAQPSSTSAPTTSVVATTSTTAAPSTSVTDTPSVGELAPTSNAYEPISTATAQPLSP